MIPDNELGFFFTIGISILGFLAVGALVFLLGGVIAAGAVTGNVQGSLILFESVIAVLVAVPVTCLVVAKEKEC